MEALENAWDRKRRLVSQLEQWHTIRRRFGELLRGPREGARWLEALQLAAADLKEWTAQDVDSALYVLLYDAAREVQSYSAAHAVACALICQLAATELGAASDDLDSLYLAALTMNVSITSLQDTLTQQKAGLTDEQASTIASHSQDSVTALREAGVDDVLWLDLVRWHHTPQPPAGEIDDRHRPFVELLRRTDIYTAKLSRRAGRPATSAARAAREVVLGASGKPDSIGAALIRALGMYPPGTWVRLASEEFALVIRRGQKAHVPQVAAVRRVNGSTLTRPTRRDTSEAAHTVMMSLAAQEVLAEVDHLQVLSATLVPDA